MAGRVSATLAPDAAFQGTASHVLVIAVEVADTYDIEAFVSSRLGSKVGSAPPSAGPSTATKQLQIQLYLAADDLRPFGIELSMPSDASACKAALQGRVERSPTALSVG